jgi:hypothetical protein
MGFFAEVHSKRQLSGQPRDGRVEQPPSVIDFDGQATL